MAQRLKRLPAMQETWVQSLGQEDPLEKGMATHSGILAWRIPLTEEPGGLQSMGLQRVLDDRATNTLNRMRLKKLKKSTRMKNLSSLYQAVTELNLKED